MDDSTANLASIASPNAFATNSVNSYQTVTSVGVSSLLQSSLAQGFPENIVLSHDLTVATVGNKIAYFVHEFAPSFK